MRNSVLPFFALIVILSASLATFAQTSATASVAGTITDVSGAVVAGAEVELLDSSTGQARKVTTGSNGYYIFPSVAPGIYKVTVKQAGFKNAQVPALKVDIAKSYSLDLTLEIGNVGETVEVVAGAAVELQKLDATVGTVIGGEQLLRLPSINRSAAALLTVQPMVQPTRGQGVLGGGQVAGARSDQSTFNLDGADATDLVAGTGNYVAGAIDFQGPTPMIPVPAESVEEFRVSTTNPNATFGRSAGGQVSLVTKRGTNSVHGSAYWYHQNDNLNANRWELNRLKIKKPELKDNRFGGTLGGPIWRDKLFLFGNYEGRRLPQSAIITRLVPSATLKQGILRFRDASSNVVSYDLKTSTLCGSGTQACDPRALGISPLIRNFWNKFPNGNDASVGDGLNTIGFVSPSDATLRMDFGVARLDYIFNEKWRFNGTYRYSTQGVNDVTQVDIIGFAGGTPGTPNTLGGTVVEPRFSSFQLTGQLTPTLVNEFTFGYARNWWAYKRQRPTPQLAGTDGALMIALGTLDQGFEVDTQRARSRIWRDHIWQFGDNLTWVKNNHTFQTGGTWRKMPVFHERDDKVVGSLTSLVYELNARTAASVPAGNRPQTCGGGITTNCLQAGDVTRWNDLYTGALGIIDKGGILATRDGSLKAQPLGTPLQIDGQFHAIEFYGNDVWRIKPSLTVTAGLTYSIQTAPIDKNGKQTFIIDTATKEILTSAGYLEKRRAAALSGNVYNPQLGWLPINDSGRDHIYPTDLNNFGPRVSAAWSPGGGSGWLGNLLGQNKTVFRGGYSLTYDRTNGVAIIMVPILGIGFSQTLNCSGPRRDGTCVVGSTPDNAFRLGVDGSKINLPALGQAVSPTIPAVNAAGELLQFSIDPNLTIGKSHSFDFTVQRELPGNMLIEVGYAGRLGRNLQQNVQLSTIPLFMKDSASGQTFAQAFDAVATALRSSQTPAAQPWFENQLKGSSFCTSTCTAALAAAQGANFIAGNVNTIFSVINGRRPAGPIINTQVTDLFVRTNGGLSNYHSGFVSLTKRFSEGLLFSVNYTLSRSLDQYGLNQEFIGVMSYSYDFDVDYGPSLWDRTHVLNANWYYDLPFGKGRRYGVANPVLEKVLGGWYSSGIFIANSGLPLTVGQSAQVFGGDPLGFALTAGAIPKGNLNFPNAVNRSTGSGTVGTTGGGSGTGLNYFSDPKAGFDSFRHVLIGQDTRHGRGVLRGFPRWNVDLSIGKKTTITERVKTVFTFDLINAFNRVEFNDPGMSILAPQSFGVITSQFASPRQIQLGLRFEF
jgi:hypothetical protein